MNDAHAEIRKALAAGPTHGPWRIEPLKYVDGHAIWSGKPGGRDEYRVAGIGGCVPTRDQSEANAALICACHPEAIRALLAERDALEAEITEHNADCVRQCEARKAAGRSHCPMQGYKGRCSDCPRDGMVDSAIAASGAGKEMP